MRPSLRFLALAVLGWAGIRGAMLGVLPGAEIFSIDKSEAKAPPPLVPTEFPPIEPIAPAGADEAAANYLPAGYAPVPSAGAHSARAYYASVSVPARSSRLTTILPDPAPAFYSPIPALDEWPLSRLAATSMPATRSNVTLPAQSLPVATLAAKIDRVQLTAWALLRGRQGAPLGTPSLASGGTLGGSQAGSRLSYNFTRQIAATFRTTTDIGRRGGEIAAGVRVQPVRGIPVWLTAERRQKLGRYGGGRNAFALFLEGGVYQRPMPWRFSLDAYLQGGVVGFRHRDEFIDGGLTLTRPIFRQFSGGFGVWGAAQPGVYRLDAGPRVTMKVRNNVRVHLDWRQKLAGDAEPGSGPAVTLAGDF